MEDRACGTPVTVSPVSPYELPQVEELEHLWAREDITPNPYEPTPKEELAEHSYLFVAKAGNRIIGHITADRLKEDGSIDYPMGLFGAGTPFIHIEGMYVLPEWRKRGIGKMLLQGVIGQARMDGVSRFRLTAVHRDTGPLVRFYLANGFTRHGEPGRYGEVGMYRED
jgi:GNAT superfamily N-acetyltransferase